MGTENYAKNYNTVCPVPQCGDPGRLWTGTEEPPTLISHDGRRCVPFWSCGFLLGLNWILVVGCEKKKNKSLVDACIIEIWWDLGKEYFAVIFAETGIASVSFTVYGVKLALILDSINIYGIFMDVTKPKDLCYHVLALYPLVWPGVSLSAHVFTFKCNTHPCHSIVIGSSPIYWESSSLNILHVFTHLPSTTKIWSKYNYYPHFTDDCV